MGVDKCGDGASSWIVFEATEDESIGEDLDRFVGVSLKETGGGQEADFDAGDIVCGQKEGSKRTRGVVERPSNSSLAFNS